MSGEVDRSRSAETVGHARGLQTISFGLRHSGSEAFKALFLEGMGLVETAAAYLDGAGRESSKTLRRPAALAYATESMRLTTRLMQVASWLLLRRAVNEGELTPAQAASEKHRVRLARQELACDAEIFAELPPAFQELCERSLRIQARVLHLDKSIAAARDAEVAPRPSQIAAQMAQLSAAFGVFTERRTG
jgi:regulator of CtrA degradation